MADGRLPPHGPLALTAIPLRRPGPIAFLRDWHVPARGARVVVVEQRPQPAVRTDLLDRLADADDDAGVVGHLLAADHTDAHLGASTTDRLVTRHLLDGDDGFLERNLGGWSPLWFGVLATADDAAPDDPLLAVREELVRYGEGVTDVPVPHGLVTDRLEHELGGANAVRDAAAALRELRRGGTRGAVDALVAVATGAGGPPLPRLLALDELLEQLYRCELAARRADAEDDRDGHDELRELQRRIADEHGVRMLLKGEYVMGRHRRSTVLLAEGLDVVVKQPAPEPEHDVVLAGRTHDGMDENWPDPLDGGRMLTSRGVIARIVHEGAIERVNEVFARDVQFSTALGISVEPFAQGPTLAALAVDDHEELTAARYDEVLVHQLVCEELGVDNPDWHAANFMVTGDGLVHVDWGAARTIGDDEWDPRGVHDRLEQVRELAWSFQSEALAERTVALHERATADPAHLDRLRDRARSFVARRG